MDIAKIFDDLPGQLNKLPIAIVLMLFINAVGLCLKAAKCFANRYIPITLILLGGITYAMVGSPGSLSPDIRHPYVVLFMYGTLIGFAAWANHRLILKRVERFFPGFKTSMGFDTDPELKKQVDPQK